MFPTDYAVNKLTALAAVVALSGGLAACGGGSSKTTMGPDPEPMPPEPTPQEMCEDAGGRWNADMTCTTADQLAAMAAAATKAAGTKATAIATESAQAATGGTAGTDGAGGADAGLGGSSAPATTDSQNAGEYNLAIDPDGTMVSITVEGATADDNVMFELAADMMDGRTMHTRTHEADTDGNVMTEVAIVYNDRDMPTPVAFAMWEAMDGMTPQELNARDLDTTADGPDGDGDLTNDFTALSVVTANFAQIKASGFSSSGAGTLSYAFDDGTTDDMDEAFETAGTYNGAPGTYRCNDTSACSVTYDAMGKISGVSGAWVFTPDADAMSPQPDYDYLHYGFWLKRTADSEGVTTYNEVETFAGSSIAASGSIASVTGTASYTGGAVGVYVRNVFASDGTIDKATSGHFKADASLMAYFGGGDVAANKHNTIVGTINNFVLSGGEANEWSVALQSDSDLTTDGIQGSDTGTNSGTAKGGVEGMDGSFTATFHGPVAAVDGVVPKPHTVVGEFNSTFSDGSVAGGFGARIVEEEE